MLRAAPGVTAALGWRDRCHISAFAGQTPLRGRSCPNRRIRSAGASLNPPGGDVGNDDAPRPIAKVPAAIAATGPEIGAQSSILTFSALFTVRTPSVARAIEIARSAAAWVGTLPFRVTTP
jgi:hypothetical protein